MLLCLSFILASNTTSRSLCSCWCSCFHKDTVTPVLDPEFLVQTNALSGVFVPTYPQFNDLISPGLPQNMSTEEVVTPISLPSSSVFSTEYFLSSIYFPQTLSAEQRTIQRLILSNMRRKEKSNTMAYMCRIFPNSNIQIIACNPSYMKYVGLSQDELSEPNFDIKTKLDPTDKRFIHTMKKLLTDPQLLEIEAHNRIWNACNKRYEEVVWKADIIERKGGEYIDILGTGKHILEESNKQMLHLAKLLHEIKGQLYIVSHQEAPEQSRKTALEVIDKLISSYLSYTRLSLGFENIVEENFKFKDFILMIQEYSRAKKLTCEIECAEDIKCGTFLGPYKALLIIMTNLINNSERFAKGVFVKLNYNNGQLFCEFSDNGPGIPEGKKDAIWSSFESVTTEDARRREGNVGLGLGTVKMLIEQAEGNIRFFSKAKLQRFQGAHFMFNIPLNPVCTEIDDIRSVSSAILLKDQLDAVVVDDNPIICQINKKILAGLGLETENIRCFSDEIEKHILASQSSLEYLSQKTFESRNLLLVLDNHMTGLDGVDLLAKLLTIPTYRDLAEAKKMAVIFCTGGDDIGEHIDLPFIKMVQKGCRTKELVTQAVQEFVASGYLAGPSE